MRVKNFNFNEKNEIESMIANGYVDESDYRKTIGMLALYNLKVLNLNREDNYDSIKDYMTLHAKDFFEPEYQTTIYNEIRYAKKRILRDIEQVMITHSELDKISSLNDIRKEKIAFVLLATAKYYDAIKRTTDHYTNLKNSEICKFARVTMRSSDRDVFMNFMYDDEIVEKHIRPNSTGKKVLIISDCEVYPDDPVEITLDEVGFKELAYQYLNWKDNGDGFMYCERCGRIMKYRPRLKYCEECAKSVQAEQKHEFYISSKN